MTHGETHGLGAAAPWVLVQLRKGLRGELHRGIRSHLPMRDEQRTGARIEEGAREAGEGFRALAAAARRIARREDYPVRIELESRDFRSGEEAIVALEGLGIAGSPLRWRQYQSRFGGTPDLTGQSAMRRKVQDTIIGEPTVLGEVF